MEKASTKLKNKREAAKAFTELLLSSNVRNTIAKVVLFGSVTRGKVKESSDVDILIIGTHDLDRLREKASDLQFEIYDRYGEGIEYLVYPLERTRYPNSYFLYRVLRCGEELYGMDDKNVRRKEAENYLVLSEEFLEGAQEAYKTRRWRIALDAAYNAAELCVKGLLLIEQEDLPTSHGGLVGEFGKLYVKPGKVSRALGRKLNQSLELRNKARYELNADFNEQKTKDVLDLAKQLQDFLAKHLH